ncbi:MAG: hypothetical protein GU362_00240 [Thaumarchaeota archaeon]|nr:hypothetical protein [Nitrososphaerota archaeon]
MESVKRIKFSFNKPVGYMYLYDRSDEIKKLSESESAFLLGPLGIGKTSLLKSYLEHKMCNALWINGERIRNFNSFVNSLKREYSKLLKNRLAKSAGQFSELNAPLLEIESYKEGKSDRYTFLNNFLDYLAFISDQKICLVIDDFTEIRKIGPAFLDISRAIYKVLKKRKISILLASSELGYAREILEKKDLPFKKVFSVLTLKPFGLEVSFDFLSKGLEDYGVSCPKKYIGDSYYVSEGFPLWLSLIGLRMLEGKCAPEGIYTDKRAQLFWVERLTKLSVKEKYMLRLIAKGESYRLAGPHSRRVLNSLIRRGYIIKNKQEVIVDPVLQYLLKMELI